ncbi:glutathione S-transferase [Albimonas donghaensis]|uniref:Glutathione S-transferase n=1 Tax=Albimonas donghaensis TaxID=356660 RepID=A0A1H3C073_9RHOB|nr:glutathione S-transferase family protein [Albimonas donghaensis]SDX47470.1 glutathione S-transferase [Albimonas donghaensis]
MITLHGFGKLFPAVIGETRDLRAQWALEETGLPYRVRGLDHAAGEHLGEDFGRISPFRLLPVIEDNGFVVAESGAILLYLAETSGRLIPADLQGRTRVAQWCFAALATVERPMMELQLIDKFGEGEADPRRAGMVEAARRWLDGLERRLADRPWIAGEAFTVADILLVSVLREIRRTDLLGDYPRVADLYARASARPAWRRTLDLYAARLGVAVEDIA